MKLRTDVMSILLSIWVFIASMSATLIDLGLMEEIPIDQEQKPAITSSGGGGGGGSGGNSGGGSFNLELYIPSELKEIGTVTKDIYYESPISDRLVTARDILCYKTGILPDTLGENCSKFNSSYFENTSDYIKVHNFYAGFRFSDVQVVTSSDNLAIEIRSNVINFILNGSDTEQASVSGTVYHPERTDLSTSFNLEFSVTQAVYGQ